jgi:hypothetical protein
VRHFARPPASVRANEAENAPEKIRPQWAFSVERRPIAEQDHEQVVREVLDFSRANPEPTQRSENVVELSLEGANAGVLGDELRRRGANEAEIQRP